MKIPVLMPTLPRTEDIVPYLRKIDDSRIYSNYGPLWREFRFSLANYFRRETGGLMPDVTFCANGTQALELALRLRTAERSGTCLMPAYTFIATAHAVANAGLDPHFLDIDASSLTLTPAIAAEAVSRLPEKPAAVVVVSPFGGPIDVREWEHFEYEHGIPVVFDAAAAITAIKYIGAQPICLSLHATKVLGIGEGGAILSTDAEMGTRLTAMTGFGFGGAERTSIYRGGNYRISEYAAAIGLAVLASFDAKVEKLKELIMKYRAALLG